VDTCRSCGGPGGIRLRSDLPPPPADLVLGVAPILTAIVGRSFLDPTEDHDVRPYLETWTLAEGVLSRGWSSDATTRPAPVSAR
jgi:hypothetical protein